MYPSGNRIQRAFSLAAATGLVLLLIVLSGSRESRAGPVLTPFSTMTVTTSTDVGQPDPNLFLSLREAMLLAKGSLSYDALSAAEKGLVNRSGVGAPGAGSADSIVFLLGAGPVTIPLTSSLPQMNTGLDSVSATGDAVNGASNIRIQGAGTQPCFQILSDNNTIAGLEISGCTIGINVPGGDNNVIGGTVPSTRNTIHSNGTGILLSFGAGNNAVRGNVINQNADEGIEITGLNTTMNTVTGNTIGTDLSDTEGIGNETGVLIADRATFNTIGGDSPALRNVISGNEVGIRIDGATSSGNSISGNYIGPNAAGDAPLPNVFGVLVGGDSTTIGGQTEGARNVISGNTALGMTIASANNSVRHNYLGTDASGSEAVGNGRGISVVGGESQTHDNTITDNLISGNGAALSGSGLTKDGTGIELADGLRTEIYRNLIGTDATGKNPLANQGPGIHILDARVTYIGGFTEGVANTIAFNEGAGILFTEFASGAYRAYIAGNSIHSNNDLGIDFYGDGVTENDDMDPDTGPNSLQNFPVLTSADIPDVKQSGSKGEAALIVTGTLNSTPGLQFEIQFFASDECDPSGHGEGQELIAHPLTAAADGQGNVEFSFELTTPVAPGRFITALASNPDADEMSEFSNCVEVIAPATPTPTPSPTPSPTPTASPETPTPTATEAPTPTPTATATPGPTPTSGPKHLQGDVDCDGDVDTVDALKQLRHVASLAVQQEEGCPQIGSAALFGDVDCDEDVDSVDALFVLRHVAVLPVNQNEPCADIGTAR